MVEPAPTKAFLDLQRRHVDERARDAGDRFGRTVEAQPEISK